MSYVQRPVILKFVFHESTYVLYARYNIWSWRGNKKWKLWSRVIRHTTAQVTRHGLTQARKTLRVVRATSTTFGLHAGKIIFNTYMKKVNKYAYNSYVLCTQKIYTTDNTKICKTKNFNSFVWLRCRYFEHIFAKWQGNKIYVFANKQFMNFAVAPCINNIRHFIFQLMHTNCKIFRLLK